MSRIVAEPVARYLASLNRLSDPVLDEIARENTDRDLSPVDAEVGALLRVLATSIGASRILEIGTGIGYSGIWLAGALPPGGMLLTLEINPERVKDARENFAKAGLAGRANVIVGDASLTIAKVSGPFDLIFQDGRKSLYPALLDRLVSRLRPGGLLVTNNVLCSGEVVPELLGFNDKPEHDAADANAITEYNKRLTTHPDLMTAITPLRDGVAISVKKSLDGLTPLLVALEKSTKALRGADFNDDARSHQSPVTSHQSPVASRQSSVTSRQS
jgi:predicted O-methyltransferase YrrM